MNSTEIKDYIVAILTKSKSIDDVPIEHVHEIQEVLEYLQKAKFISPDQQKKNKAKAKIDGNDRAFYDARIKGKPSIGAKNDQAIIDAQPEEKKKENPFSIVKMEDAGAGAGADAGVVKYDEVVKIDDMGQWKIEKAVKPGATLNYAEMNKPKNTEKTPANTLNYKEMNKPKGIDKPQNTLDYKKMSSTVVGDEQAAREAKHGVKREAMIGGSPEKDAGAKEMARRRAELAGTTEKDSALTEITRRRDAKS